MRWIKHKLTQSTECRMLPWKDKLSARVSVRNFANVLTMLGCKPAGTTKYPAYDNRVSLWNSPPDNVRPGYGRCFCLRRTNAWNAVDVLRQCTIQFYFSLTYLLTYLLTLARRCVCLTLSVPHFSDCGKNESSKALSVQRHTGLTHPFEVFDIRALWRSGLSVKV